VNGRWYHALLIALLLGQLLLLAADERARSSRLERGLLWVLGPFAHGVGAVGNQVGELVAALRSNRALRADNAVLRQQLEEARRELMRLADAEEELRRLSRILDYTREHPAGDFFVADVVYLDQASGLRTLVLFSGNAELRRNQVVRTPQGLVGRIILTAGHYAKVQLITDRASAVSAMIERTRRKGIVRGAGTGGLELHFMPEQADVRPGDRVVTAGIDGIYERGIPIGEVVTVGPVSGLFRRIVVRPAIDFSLLEQVYVLAGGPLPPAMAEGEADAPP